MYSSLGRHGIMAFWLSVLCIGMTPTASAQPSEGSAVEFLALDGSGEGQATVDGREEGRGQGQAGGQAQAQDRARTQGQGQGQHEREQDELGHLVVRVLDADSSEPLVGSTVRLQGQDRGGISDQDGVVRLNDLRVRTHSLVVERFGYMEAYREVEIREGETAELEVALVPSPIHLSGVVVTGTGRERGPGEVYRPTTTLSGIELQRNLASSVPATLEAVPGFSAEFNGPAAARPSIRGMGGDRVLVLEDGQRTGDLYATASDHGVMVEPLSASRIEVVRGPAGLLYGANALGGVVNVIRNEIPRTRPATLEGMAGTHLESVRDGVGLGGVVAAPVGPFALRLEGTARRAGDTRTPEGPLEQTDVTALSASAGASWIRDWGFVGVSGRVYDSTYGVPGEFDGVLIPGGHPGGVDIEALRQSLRFRAAYLEPFWGFFDSAEVDAGLTSYLHDEIEGLIGGQRVMGARFDQTTRQAGLIVRHDHALHDHEGPTLRAEGAYGIHLEDRELLTGGVSPGSRSAKEWAVALYAFEDFQVDAFRLQAGARWDRRDITPFRTDSLRVRTQQRRITKPVTPRDFNTLSGSLAVLWELRSDWTLGVNLARSHRPPAIQELYSDGPHLADFSFDIGSPDLEAERGTGVDLFLRARRPDLNMEISAFHNRVDGYIYYLQTGETVLVSREGTPDRDTPVFEARGDDAVFFGAEGRVQWEAFPRVVVDVTASYTRAERRMEGDPLPFIPPLNGRAEIRWEGEPFFASLGGTFAAAQNRVPRPVTIGDLTENPQQPTSGYGLLNAGLGWRTALGGRTHTVTLQARNLADRSYRDHLSRVKEVAPQPGRNLSLSYRLHF
ncbi:MAG: TonB-dependent receptor [Gemmatimonadales bacterium]|nr:MAG: TonB-dependent receptor [Gemmatimonadales bacterium]